MRVKRVAVLEPIAHLGGAQISLLELTRALKGEPRIVVILPEDGPLRAAAEAAGAEVHIFPWPLRLMQSGERSASSTLGKLWKAALAGLTVPGLAWRLRRFLKQIDVDVLATNGIKAHVLGAVASLGSSRLLVWYLRDGMQGRRLSATAMRLFSGRCGGAIAISHFVKTETQEFLPRSVSVSVIYNIVDFSKFETSRPPADLKKAPGEIWFGIVGALAPLKGQDIFLRAARQVAAEIPQARFLIVGGNFYRTAAGSTYEESLRALADAPELAGRVSFLGQRSDIASIMPMLDVLVQSNRQPEALGRTILEAMASRVAVIAVDRWGPAELVAHERTGLLTPLLDEAALTRAMLRLAREPQTRRALTDAAWAWAHHKLDPDRIAGEFREALAGPASVGK